ncbi:glycoside hydrolase family 2 protein [candidate division KSB1 bacterium]|nr:glycoside hydrolase family 2 protein [candidate division KSB1 bacterium]
MKIKIQILKIIIFSFLIPPLSAQPFLDHRTSFNLETWKFHKGDIYSAENRSLDTRQGWQDITVPHTWNADDVLTNGNFYYQGIGWYRTEFELPADRDNQRYFLRFDGVSLVTDVFINGKYLGEHKGGYSAFCFDITSHLIQGEKNTIAIKVDNSMQPDVAPSGVYLYPLFGGIYRPVTIFCTNDVCISPLNYASSGIYVKQKNVSAQNAEFDVDVLFDYTAYPSLQLTSNELLPPEGVGGTGMYAEYFNNAELTGRPVHTRIDTVINFVYGDGAPFGDMSNNNFSVRWTGQFMPERTGTYRFVLKSDDGSRLWVDGERLIDNWGSHPVTEKTGDIQLEAQKTVNLKIEYNEYTQGASIKFGWTYLPQADNPIELVANTRIVSAAGKLIADDQKTITLQNGKQAHITHSFDINKPHLWDAKRDPYLYTLIVQLEDSSGNVLDTVEQPFGLRYFDVDVKRGLILNGRPYHLYGVCRHQEWEGLGPALTDENHEKDIDLICEVGANGVRLAHYQQAEKIYSLCDEKGLVVWAEIPNTPAYREENPAYLQNCVTQLTELILQNYNHPSILFWGMYNEIPIPTADVQILHNTAKQLDPVRLTTQADYTYATDRHFVTDVAAWNWYYGWYYGEFDRYGSWYDELYKEYPTIKAGLSEYGAGGCIDQQQENPERPDPTNGRFFPEQYQRLYHENVWENIKDRQDIWCKFLWNMFDFSWTVAHRGDRDFINHKGLVTHDRKVKKDAFYFYKANWSDAPVLYISSRRDTERTEPNAPVEVYTNLEEVELFVNGLRISGKRMDSDIHKLIWQHVNLSPGPNQISVIGKKGNKTFTDSCEWNLSVK